MAHKLTLNLDVFSPLPLYLQIATQVRNAIESNRLSQGERLPSIRDFAKQLQLSQSTIREAMDKLIEWEFVISRPGSGNFVARKEKDNTGEAQSEAVSSGDNAVFLLPTFVGVLHDLDPKISWSKQAQLLNQCLNEHPFHPWWNTQLRYDFRSWECSFDFMQGSRWEKLVSAWTSKLSSMPQGYSDAAGLPDLRSRVADWLNRTRNLNCSPDNLLISTGAQQCRDLVGQLLVDEKSRVVVEEPASITDVLAYEARGAHLVHIPQDRDGLRVDLLSGVKADLAHVISTANFPSGACLSRARRIQLLEWAEENKAIIVEDAFGAGFYYQSPEATLYQLAQERNLSDFVIYHGSFSQPFMPALRIGYVLLPAWLKQIYFRAKWLSDRHPSTITQTLLLQLFQDGFFEDHFLKLTAAAAQRRKALIRELTLWPHDLIQFDESHAGLHQAIWFKPEKKIDDMLVFERAMKDDIGVIPLSPYFFMQEKRTGLLLNFLGLPEKEISEGCRKLLSVILSCSASLSN